MARIYNFVFIASLFTSSLCSAMDVDNRQGSIGTHMHSTTQEITDVAVVGGGLAGLTAALRLHQSKKPYVLYEARDRLGGRTYSEVHGAHVVNMGGEWIDSDHKAMQALATELGCKLQKETYSKPIRVSVENTDFSPDQIIEMLTSIFQKLPDESQDEKLARRYDQTMWQYTSLEQILPSTLTPTEQQFIRTYLEADTGLSPNALQAPAVDSLKEDLKEFLDLFEYKKSWWKPARALDLFAYQYRVVGGMTELINAIRDRLAADRIRLQHVLTRVHKDENDKFHLFFNLSDGAVHEVVAKAVMMTVPFSVLRTVDLDASLRLTPLHTEAIQTLSYGTNGKVQVFGEINPNFRYLTHTTTHTTSWAPPTGPGLTIFTSGDTGATLSEETAGPLVRAVLTSVSGTHAGAAQASAAEESVQESPPFIVKNWSADPFARGSYSAAGLHSPALDVPSELEGFAGSRRFAEPVGGFIFAGEHTRMIEGYMNGAVESGELAAQHYLRRFEP